MKRIDRTMTVIEQDANKLHLTEVKQAIIRTVA